jgi:hypothetical protein
MYCVICTVFRVSGQLGHLERLSMPRIDRSDVHLLQPCHARSQFLLIFNVRSCIRLLPVMEYISGKQVSPAGQYSDCSMPRHKKPFNWPQLTLNPVP